MGFLTPFHLEERTSSSDSILSDGSHASSPASASPKAKCRVVPNEQATFGRMSETGGENPDGTFPDGSPLKRVVRTSALNKSFSSAIAARRDIRPAEKPHHKLSRIEYTSIDQFQQRTELYRGSISTVYKAICTASQTPVIIKAYDKSKMKPKNLARVEREICLMQQLGGGSGVVELYCVFEDSAHRYLIMEHCKGGDLFKVLMMKGGTLDEAWVCTEIIAPLLSVLAGMHKDNIIHRDIKPENIFLTSSMRFKLGDFGLAIKSNEELPFTRSGTLDYMAPEVLGNHTTDLQESPHLTRAQLKAATIRPYDEKVDVWAAGILAYECVVGKPPFEVNDEVQTATLIMYSNKIYFPQRHSPEWKDFVKVSLEKNPHQRPSAATLLNHPWIRMHSGDTLQGVVSQNLEATPKQATQSTASAPLPENLPFARKSSLQSVSTPRTLSTLSRGSSGLSDMEVAAAIATSSLAQPKPTLKGRGLMSEQRQSEGSGKIKAIFPPGTFKSGLSRTLLAVHMTLEANNQKPAALSLSRPMPGYLVDAPGQSFTALLNRPPLDPPSYIDSAEVVDGADLSKNGLRIRIKTYFNRQKMDGPGPARVQEVAAASQ